MARATPLKFQLKTYEPAARGPCMCGSGLRFRHCCSEKYGLDGYEKGRALIATGEFKKALPELRRHLTWYRLSHLAHTASLLPSTNPEILRLLELDIGAMFEMVERLMFCYKEVGVIHEFPALVEELACAIDDPRWLAKIAYFKALYLSNTKSKSAAWRVIEQSRLLGVLEDEDLLSISIEAAPEQYSVSDRISLIDRLLAITKDVNWRLQYTALKGILTFTELDDATGVNYILTALDEYERVPVDERSLYGQLQLGGFYYTAASLTDRDDLVARAITQLQSCLKNPDYTFHAKADILKDCGECHLYRGEWQKAQACFEASQSEKYNLITDIYSVRAMVGRGDYASAFKSLGEIDIRRLGSANKLDLGIAWAELALATQLEDQRNYALNLLQNLECSRGYFEKIRMGLIVDLKSKKQINPAKPAFYRRLFTRYVLLQPNWNGLGINLNAIIEDIFPERPSGA